MAFVRNEEIRLELFNINKRGEVREREKDIIYTQMRDFYMCCFLAYAAP